MIAAPLLCGMYHMCPIGKGMSRVGCTRYNNMYPSIPRKTSTSWDGGGGLGSFRCQVKEHDKKKGLMRVRSFFVDLGSGRVGSG